MFSEENRKLEQMPSTEYEKLTDEEKDELWESWMQEAEHSTDSAHHLLEFKNINRNELTEIDWIVWDRIDKDDMNEHEFTHTERVQIEVSDESFNQSRASLYAMLRNHLIGDLVRKRFEK